MVVSDMGPSKRTCEHLILNLLYGEPWHAFMVIPSLMHVHRSSVSCYSAVLIGPTPSVGTDNAIYGDSLTDVVRTTVSHDRSVMVFLTQMFFHWTLTIQLWCFSGMLLQSHLVVTMQLWDGSHRFSWNHTQCVVTMQSDLSQMLSEQQQVLTNTIWGVTGHNIVYHHKTAH